MIISKEESQDQVQVYIEEIIQENPGDKEEKFRASCDSYYGNNDGFCYIDPSNTNTMVDYCEDLAVTCTETGLGCKPRCDLFKRGRCDDTNYCKWTVDNICKCSGPVEICDNDGTCDSGEGCSCQDCHGKHDGCPDENICSRREESEDYRCLGYIGESCSSNDDCASGLICNQFGSGRDIYYECR